MLLNVQVTYLGESIIDYVNEANTIIFSIHVHIL